MCQLRSTTPVALACVASLALAVPAAEAPAADPCPDADLVPSDANLGRVGQSVMCLVNEERAARGEPPLESASELRLAAQRMSELMVERRSFSHVTPDGLNLADRLQPTGFLPSHDHWLLGENLAWGGGGLATPRAIVRGWMDSEGHRLNILEPRFEEAGIGLTNGSPSPDRDGGTTFTLDFGTRDTRPALSVPARLSADADSAAASGIRYRAACSRPCTLRAHLVGRRQGDEQPIVLASGRRRLTRAGTATVTLGMRAGVAASPQRLEGTRSRLLTEAADGDVARSTRVRLR